MDKDKVLRLVIFYSLTVITLIITVATTLFTWAAHGCGIAEGFLEKQTNNFRS